MTRVASPESVQPRLFHNTGIRPSALDPDAVKIIGRLRRKGHDAFLVGGCVRDLLLARKPKDFDVATAARPRQVKSLFRNCRIIGRRFKLAHLHFDDKILEVSTFRRRPEGADDDDDLLITNDNAFGTANEDAHRRDFTINALFFDPEADCIHDYVGGIEDIQARIVRTIGDPLTRIKEDPVRILRAVKFASRLSLKIEPATWGAICEAAEDLSRAAPPRILEELLRLMRSGTSLKAFQLLRDCGALRVLLPEVAQLLAAVGRDERLTFWRLLEAVDGLVRSGKPVTPPVLFGALFYPLLAEAQKSSDSDGRPLAEAREADLGKLAESVLGPILKRLNLSRAESGRLKRICVVQRRFAKGKGRRSFKPASFVRQEYFEEALQLYRARCIATGEGWDGYDDWLHRHEEAAGSREGDRTSRRNGRREPTKERPREDRRPERTGSKRKRRRRKKQPEESLPPLPAVQLDPHEVPTYGSVLGDTGSADKIELEASRGKRARKRQKASEQPYVPPPPKDNAQRPRDDDPDTFGDW